MVPGGTSVEAWIAEVSRLACCASYRQDLHVTTCGSFGFLPCVRAHSALVTKLHCPEVEVRNDDPIDHCCAVVCTRRGGGWVWCGRGRVPGGILNWARHPLWFRKEIPSRLAAWS